MAWHARLLAAAALMVTLNIRAAAARRAGDHQAAQQAQEQAGRLHPLLGQRDPATT